MGEFIVNISLGTGRVMISWPLCFDKLWFCNGVCCKEELPWWEVRVTLIYGTHYSCVTNCNPKVWMLLVWYNESEQLGQGSQGREKVHYKVFWWTCVALWIVDEGHNSLDISEALCGTCLRTVLSTGEAMSPYLSNFSFLPLKIGPCVVFSTLFLSA